MSTRSPFLLACFSLVLNCFLSISVNAAGATRVLPEGQLPKDARLQPLKDLEGYFPFTPPVSRGEWEQRAERVRRQIRVSLGLWPWPNRTPLNPVIHGAMDRGDYVVEKVYFESFPGFFVTGNLYRPKGRTGKLPGVLCPHGHWNNGRFYDQGEDGVRREIVQGAERFEEGGRSPLQSRCVQLARMGCVVFHYDMLGYADSIQIPMGIAHGFAKQRPEMNTAQNWGLFSPQAEAHLQSVMGLQTWNSVRALDFLLGLAEVDGERIACTGASGGGTQTFILSALEPRVKVAFPAVMVSTAMQGGCTCENACLLRVDTGNIEFAGLFAPRPQAMTSADDWTKEMATKGFPELKRLYTLLGAPENLLLKRGEHFGHNYNYVSRAAMYAWFNKHLQLGFKEPIVEGDFKRLTQPEMSVWDAEHPAPKAADPEFERGLLRRWHEDIQKQLAADQSGPERFGQSHGGGVAAILGRTLADAGTVEWEMLHKEDRGAWTEMNGLVRAPAHNEEFPAVFLHPKQWSGVTVVWLTGEGKSGLYAGDGLNPDVRKLVEAGATVMGADLFQQGEFRPDGQALSQTGRVKNPREAAAYTFGYNHAVFSQRVHDVLSAVQFIRNHERPSKRLYLAGLAGAGPIAAAARAVCGEAIHGAVIDTSGFRFGRVLDIHDPNFLPGGAIYGDLPGMLALGAPGPLWVAGEEETGLTLVKKQYGASAPQNLTVISSARAGQVAAEVLAVASAR